MAGCGPKVDLDRIGILDGLDTPAGRQHHVGAIQRGVLRGLVGAPPGEHFFKVAFELEALQLVGDRGALDAVDVVRPVNRGYVIADPEGLFELDEIARRTARFR